jgi:hypothetical protein
LDTGDGAYEIELFNISNLKSKGMRKFTFLLTLALFATILSCQQSIDLQPTDGSDTQTVTSLDVKPNYLSFSDWKQFNGTLESLKGKTRTERENWEKAQGFTSLNTLYEYVLDEELANIAKEETALQKDPNLRKTMKHTTSKLALQYRDAVVVTDEGIEKNIFAPTYAYLINKDGVVKIGDALIQMKAKQTKSIKYEGKQSLDKLLSSTQTDESIGLHVNAVKSTATLAKTGNARPNGEKRADGYNPQGDLWLTAWSKNYSACFYDYTGGSGTGYYNIAQLYIEMRFLRKSWYGAWVDHRSEPYQAGGNWGQTVSVFGPPLLGHYGGYIYSPPLNQLFPLSTGFNWYGKTANPIYTLWYADMKGCTYTAPDYAPGTNLLFNFVDIYLQISY